MGFVVIWLSRHSPRPEAIELKEEVETHNSQRACDVLEAILILNKLSTRGSPGIAMYVSVAWMVASVDAVHETEVGARLVTGVDDGAGLAAGVEADANRRELPMQMWARA